MKAPYPDAREAQQFVGSEIQIISDHEVIGYTRIRGGWNNGRAYTVYFYAETDKPFVNTATWKSDKITDEKFQYDSHQKTGALLRFNSSEDVIQLKVGISFLSSLKARQNAHTDILTGHSKLYTNSYWPNGKIYSKELKSLPAPPKHRNVCSTPASIIP